MIKIFIQRLALTFALFLGAFGMAQAATLDYTGNISVASPYMSAVNVTTPETYRLEMSVDAGSPFYLLLNSTTAVSYSGSASGGLKTLSAILNLDAGVHLLYAFTTSLANTDFSIQLAPVPLPATLPLLAVALGAGGIALRRRQKKKEKRSFFPAAA